jgi:hypothetical protein
MAKVWEPKDPDTLRKWLEAILMEASDKLNEWELNFLNNIETVLDHRQRLSQAQEEKLETIYADKTK